jgi:hypothetical protein
MTPDEIAGKVREYIDHNRASVVTAMSIAIPTGSANTTRDLKTWAGKKEGIVNEKEERRNHE